MEITKVRVTPRHNEGRLKAVASVTFDDMFAAHGLRIIEGNNGLFVAMPSRKMPSGDYQDVFHPTNAEARKLLSDAVMAEYEAVTGDAAAQAATKEGA